MHQAESSSSLFCLWTGHSLPAALHHVSRRRSCFQLRTDQCFCPIGTFTQLLVRTSRRTSHERFGSWDFRAIVLGTSSQAASTATGVHQRQILTAQLQQSSSRTRTSSRTIFYKWCRKSEGQRE